MSYPDLAPRPAEFRPVEEDVFPDDPFTAVNYHFGMLLGVDDFETELAYHRGRERLHQGWLHGPGVVWGLAVRLDDVRGEVRVEPGLAIDGAGRNLHLDAAACLDPAAWYEQHQAEVDTTGPHPEDAALAFDAHVTASFATCLTRPVPALAEPCAGSASSQTAYSRVWETLDLKLVHGLAPAPADRYRRVRVLLGLLAPDEARKGDIVAAEARAAVVDAADAKRAEVALEALREMTNADAAELEPAPGALTPEDSRTVVVLANIRLALRRDEEGELRLGSGTIDLLPRRSHIATATIQELAAAALAGLPAPPPDPADPPADPPVPPADPQPAPTSVAGFEWNKTELRLALSAPLDPRSVRAEAFSVTALGADGWVDVQFKAPLVDDDATSVTLLFGDTPPVPWQVIVRGSGPRPIVDRDLLPLGGGQDFVHIERS